LVRRGCGRVGLAAKERDDHRESEENQSTTGQEDIHVHNDGPFLVRSLVKQVLSSLPAVQEVGDRFGAGVFKLFVMLGVEEFAMGVEDGECGNAFFYRNIVFLGDGDILVHVTDVDVDEDEVFGEKLSVGTLVIVDVEYLAVAAPVAAEVEEDAFVLAARLGDGSGDVGLGVGTFRVEMRVGLEEAGLAPGISR
jgi:hypothetical protein